MNDDYYFTNKLKLKSKTPDGISYEICGAQNSKTGQIDAEISATAKLKGVSLTAQAFTSGKMPNLEVEYETSDDQGRKATLSGVVGKGLRNCSAELLGGPVGAKFAADAMSTDLYGSLAVAFTSDKYEGFVIAGAESEYNVDSKKIGATNYGVSFFDGKESEISVHVSGSMKKTMLSYSHHVRQRFSAAAQIEHELQTKTTEVALGGAYKLDGATTVKGKVDMDGFVALTYLQDIRPNTKLVMSSKFDPRKLDSAKVGMSLTIE